MSTAAWYVVETQRHREPVARAVLADRGIVSYLPFVEQWPRPAVGAAVAPMFPGYLFVHASLDEQAHRVMRTNGIKAFVSFGAAPVPLGDDVIPYLRSREDSDGIIRWPQSDGSIAEVRIIQGPFRGLTAIITERLPARERVRVLMEILQRQTAVELPERWVRRV